MLRIVVFLLVSSFASPSVASSPQEEQPDRLAAARSALAEGDALAALRITDEVLRDDPDRAEAHALSGDAWLGIAAQWVEAGSSPQGPLEDARASYERALQLAPRHTDSLVGLWQTLYQLGRLDEAVAVAERELGAVMLRGSGDLEGALVRAARSRLQSFLATEAADEEESARRLAELDASLRRATQLSDGAPALAMLRSDLHVALEQPAVGAALALECLQDHPDDVGLHQRLIDLHYYQDEVDRLERPYRDLVERHPASPVVRWYHAYACLLEGDWARRELRHDAAADLYQRCTEGMARAVTLEPSFDDSARRIAFLAELGAGWCRRGVGDLDGAAQHFLTLLQGIAPDEAAERLELRDGFQRTLLDAVGTLCMDFEGARRYPRAIALGEAVVALRPDDGGWFNNLGYFYREHATQIQAGWHEVELDLWYEAEKVYRRSWDRYQRAAERAPEDARIVNDAALIQVYHLQDELPKAVEMLHRAIALGEEQLAAMGEEATEEQRFPVAQAVGDAHENLGYLHVHVYGDEAEARQHYERCLATDSGPRPNVEQILAALAEGEPIEAPRAGLGERPSEPLPGQVAWEPSLAEAQARARAENRLLCVYFRGSALGLAIPFFDRIVGSRDFAQRSREWVCVLASRGRNTVDDWGRDGRRIPSPTFGVLTCGEHVHADEEFRRDWAQRRADEDPRDPSEGLHFFRPDGTRVAVRDGFGGAILGGLREVLDALGPARDPVDLEGLLEVAAGSETGARRRAIERLLQVPGRPAAQAVEALLFHPQAAVGEAVVAGLAARDRPADRARITALLRQRAHEHLRRAAARHASEDVDPALLRAAVGWSAEVETRTAAASALLRAEPEGARRWLLAQLVVGAVDARRAAARSLGAVDAAPTAVLRERLRSETEVAVRVALCDALAATDDEDTRRELARVAQDEGEALDVRAAATRALRTSKGS